MKIYIAKINSDQTEGRGPVRVTGYFQTAEAAYESVKGKGVMGIGDGEVYSLSIIDDDSGAYDEEKVYGYHQSEKGLLGKWRHGWVDGRDLPQNDPEFDEYLRLKTKFEGV